MKKIFFSILVLVFILKQDALGLQRESDHFIFYYEAQDSSVIDTVISRLEGCYFRITVDLQLTFSEKTKVHIYPTLQEFHNAVGRPNAPDWFVGLGITEIYVVSPLNPGSAHSYNSIMNNVFIHEFTHICTGKINRNLPIWLSEGFACYEGGPYYDKGAVVSAYNGLGRIPGLDELNSSYNTFAEIGGYPFSLTIAYYIIDDFGMNAMREFIYHSNDFSIFSDLSKSEFEEKWFEYVKENYLEMSSNGFYNRQNKMAYILEQNYPNPFNPTTTISYSVPNAGYIVLKIYDSLGSEITTLVDKEQAAGTYQIKFSAEGGSASDGDTYTLSSGIYFYRIKAGDFVKTNKMALMR
jgi:hypothetical protein